MLIVVARVDAVVAIVADIVIASIVDAIATVYGITIDVGDVVILSKSRISCARCDW